MFSVHIFYQTCEGILTYELLFFSIFAQNSREGRSKAHFGVYTVEWTNSCTSCTRIGIINEWVAISKSHFGWLDDDAI